MIKLHATIKKTQCEAEISEEQIVICLIYRGVAVGRSKREEKSIRELTWTGICLCWLAGVR